MDDLRAEALAFYTTEYRASIIDPDPPPPGVETNFDGPNTYGNFYIFCAIFGFVLSTVFTAMRLYTKGFMTRALGWDDCMPFSELSWLDIDEN